eukprot:scaffold116481_cov51-Phaeocystis_antarctica.AAC.1
MTRRAPDEDYGQYLHACRLPEPTPPPSEPSSPSTRMRLQPICRLLQGPRGHPEAQEADSAAPRGLDARRRLVGPRPHGALTLCVPLGFVFRV